MSGSSRFDDDAKKLNEMILNAKYGNWDTVFTQLPTMPYFINCIPEERTWSILHQAVYSNSEENVQRLLGYPSCDPTVKTKQNPSHAAGLTPEDIASKCGYYKIRQILNDFTRNMREERFNSNAPVFVTAERGVEMDREGLPLLIDTLISYKKMFLQAKGAKSASGSFLDIMKQISDFKHQCNHWRHAQEKIASAMDTFCVSASEVIMQGQSETAFYQKIVSLYTTGYVYRQLNLALKREGIYKIEYKPAADDLAVASYCLMLDLVLFYHSEELGYRRVRETTYRGTKMSKNDLEKYQEGNRFVWLSFVSSTKDENIARGFMGNLSNPAYAHVLFEIRNDKASHWLPRLIQGDSKHSEALYPVGAEFEINYISKSYDNGITNAIIKITLLDPVNV